MTHPTEQVHVAIAESEFGVDGAEFGQEMVSIGLSWAMRCVLFLGLMCGRSGGLSFGNKYRKTSYGEEVVCAIGTTSLSNRRRNNAPGGLLLGTKSMAVAIQQVQMLLDLGQMKHNNSEKQIKLPGCTQKGCLDGKTWCLEGNGQKDEILKYVSSTSGMRAK